ncbi:LLM class flavin-dependent oxidoreductase [Kutzneria viridogrisea]|uniref:Alkanesulfonate monooxygenase SsuD/methylene tetrahydromethanopterin reductase-like flavin-dependent oxidoreductase (Luciferase family) n=1 Tax=Kutzneria viridogrisea TaxID=47990 RepID=A0ABR6BKI8_9PSEU|nr:alkanesulfonate monooxygenase SsuD/methylene tetrahydromethanopterin reductase-like flavin-dependent oxidoreductase (luciferase family) [Kutzneria viridogrisea]
MTGFRAGAMLFTGRFEGMTDKQVFDSALANAKAAEESGFDELWVTEHHYISYGVNPSALAMAAFLLGRTEKLRVGTAVTLLPTHSPVHVAEQALLLDQLSGGRFDLGLGRGGPVVDYEVMSSLDHWERGYDQAVRVLLDSYSGKVSADTEFYEFREVRPAPAPRTSPHPPTFLAGTSPEAARRAARLGLPMLFFFSQDDASKAELVALHAEEAARAGHAGPFQHAFATIAHVADTEEQAVAELIGPLRQFYGKAEQEYVLLRDRPGPQRGEDYFEKFFEFVLSTFPIGTPRTCAQRLEASVRASGVDRVLLMLEGSGRPDLAERTVRRFGAEVLPVVRSALGADDR